MSAYDELRTVYCDDILSVEHVQNKVRRNSEAGGNVILDDACDAEFLLKLQRQTT